MHPGVLADALMESGKVTKGCVSPSKANNRLRMFRTPKNTKHVCNHVLYTPMAGLRRNYETVLSWLQLAAIKASKGNICLESGQSMYAPESSELPSTWYRVSFDFVDELLDGLVISDGALERYQPSMTFVDKLIDNL